ncbi:MAG: hypothetical protein WC319_13165 [Candidatus Paceibacterota bacterium]|jgi:hydroxymethylpyrimidine pyrophosphatase-like HAD family hydrolase
MKTHIFDIDGTIVDYHTNNWIDGAKELIVKLFNNGNQIIFITMRDEIWSIENTKNTILKELDDLGIKYIILFNVSSPRIIHDDSQIIIDRRRTNQKYDGNSHLLKKEDEYVHHWFAGEGIDWSKYNLNESI